MARKVSSGAREGRREDCHRLRRPVNGVDVDAFVDKHIATGAVVTSDEHKAYAMLVAHYNLKRVNHSERYSGPNGENINQAESYRASAACKLARTISSASTFWRMPRKAHGATTTAAIATR